MNGQKSILDASSHILLCIIAFDIELGEAMLQKHHVRMGRCRHVGNDLCGSQGRGLHDNCVDEDLYALPFHQDGGMDRSPSHEGTQVSGNFQSTKKSIPPVLVSRHSIHKTWQTEMCALKFNTKYIVAHPYLHPTLNENIRKLSEA